MVREPSLESVAELLRENARGLGATLGHQASLNLAARTKGYKNLAHFRKETRQVALPVPPTPPVEAYPKPVNWEALTNADDITHIEVNGNLRTLEFKSQDQLVKLEFGDVHAQRVSSLDAVVLEYHPPGSLTFVALTLKDLLGASEVEPGIVELTDGKRLRFLAETESGFEVLWLDQETTVKDA